MRTYRARILSFENPSSPAEYRYMSVDDEGRIVGLSRGKPAITGELVDYSEYLILPGFIDAHIHLPQLHKRAMVSDSLLEWLERYIFPAEMEFSDADFARKVAREFFSTLIRNGTTTAVVYSSPHRGATEVAFEEAMKSGMRTVIGQVLMDMNGPEELLTTPERAASDIRAVASRWHGFDGRLFYAVTPRFAVSCSMELMRTASEVADRMGLYVQTHLSEQMGEIEEVRKLFPWAKSYTDVYHEAGLLGERTVVGHAIHLSDRERAILARTGTKVAHCPSSNFFLHSGVMDLRAHERLGLTVALGSDVGAGPFLSMLEVLRDAYYANAMSPAKAFHLLTMGGARALGMEDRIGSLEVGKEADFVVINPEPLAEAGEDVEVLLSRLMILGDERNVAATYVRGRELWAQHQNERKG
ncbi:guanine deaminase [Palaeococcus ferrophilus]|uniref:guanine deaminase n=1 Tax=Palaeococcus ferrophilus TaxID=83868 RepID=UPI00064E3960|nr:guanine deaminase [Palaeococcus ferrophilus]